jgi:hypothetical protein
VSLVSAVPPAILPFGLSPIGTGVATDFVPIPPPPVISADAIDPKSLDATSLTKSSDPIDAQVQLALTLVRGTGAACGDTGQNFRAILKLTDNVTTLLESEARRALALLVRRGDISIDSVNAVVYSPDSAEVTIVYVNNRAIGNRRRTKTIPIQGTAS